MTSFKFVHAADLHLDAPFEGIGKVQPDVAELLRDASLAAWDSLVDLCIAETATLLFLSGDIYDGEIRGVRAQLRFRQGLQRLSDRGIQVFIVHGNHDPSGGRWSAIRSWPPGVTVFGPDAVESVVVSRNGALLAVVHGISYPTREVTDNLSRQFRRSAEPCLQFGVLHCSVGDDPDHSAYSPAAVEDLRSAGMDYWALGHVHQHRVICSGDPWAVYSGALQGRGLKPSERGIKGAVIGEVKHGRISNVRFIPIPNVRFAECEIDVSTLEDLPALMDRLEREVEAEIDRGLATGLVLRAVLKGRGSIHSDLLAADALNELLTTVRERDVGRTPFVWWSEIRNETRSTLDRDEIVRRRDFSADLLSLADRLKADEQALGEFVAQQSGELTLPTLQRWTGHGQADAETLLSEAATLALDLLEARSGE